MHALSKDKILDYRFAPMPEIVRVSPVLTPGAKILYNQIISYFWQKDNTVAWPSQEELAFKLSMSIRGIQKQLKELKDVKLIETERIGLGKANRTYLLEPQPDLLQVEKNATGGYQPKPGKKQHISAASKKKREKRENKPKNCIKIITPINPPEVKCSPPNLPPSRQERKEKAKSMPKYNREELLEKLKELDRKAKLNNTSTKGGENNSN